MQKLFFKHIDLKLIQLFLFFIPFAFGLFYEFTAYYAQTFLLLILAIIIFKRKKIRVYLNVSSISLALISLGYLISCLYAVDGGMAFLGFLKFSIPLTFAFILMQYKQKHIKHMLNSIPIAGIVMVILSLLFKYIPFLPDLFYLQNGRMFGFFQYSNTFALFLLIGFIIFVNNQNIHKAKLVFGISILLLGILASGSRLTFLLTAFNFIFLIVKFKHLRKHLISLILLSLIFSLGYVGITNNFNSFGRYLTTSLHSSTLIERILYYKDALPILIQNPFGLGYLGYSYIQSYIQTGIYSAVYVHNDFLQLWLDIGLIPIILFVIAILTSLFKHSKIDVNKQILLTISLHMFFEFDLQFLCIFLILVLTLNLFSGKFYLFKTYKKVFVTLISIIAFIYIYFGICTHLQYVGKSNIAIKMYPLYTEANSSIMYQNAENNLSYANNIASNIIKHNKYSGLAYNIKSLYYLQNKEWKLMIKNKQKSLELNKYDISNYEEYVLMLSSAIDYYINNNDFSNAKSCIELVTKVPSIIESLKTSTSYLAYKLNNAPNFELDAQTKNYIETMKGVLTNE